MKIVIVDTNVLVCAVLRGREPRTVIQFIVDNPKFEWVVSAEILAEYKEVLSRKKFKLTSEVKAEWFDLIDTFPTIVDVNVEIDFPRDPKDAKFLACAVTSNADFLITGDLDFTEAQALVKTTIISVSSFKRLVCDIEDT